MTLYYAQGTPATELTTSDLNEALHDTLGTLGRRARVLALPPDFTRFHSRAGQLTCLVHQQLGDRLADVMPAIGTHFAMPDWQLERMFPTLPKSMIRVHNWRTDVVDVGEVPRDFVAEVTDGLYSKPWPAQLNKLVRGGGHDLVLSIGQVVPHEVIGMANYNKNLFVGTGGDAGINESHYLGAIYGMERMMGRADTPLRRILNYAEENFCGQLPVVYVQTVVGRRDDGQLATPGLFIGDEVESLHRPSALSQK
jgi:nickel-dependent lactate racemase